MSSEQESVAVLRQAEMKLRPQRVLVCTALAHAEGHVSAPDIYEQVRVAYPYLDISTVYRTLAALKQMRLVVETDMGSGDLTYEWVRDRRHHHLICTACDSVTELDHLYLERLGADLLRDYRFAADLDHFAIFGRCAACRVAIGSRQQAAGSREAQPYP